MKPSMNSSRKYELSTIDKVMIGLFSFELIILLALFVYLYLL